jgi:hypothetical protein
MGAGWKKIHAETIGGVRPFKQGGTHERSD